YNQVGAILLAAPKAMSKDGPAPNTVPTIAICRVSISSSEKFGKSLKSGGNIRVMNWPIFVAPSPSFRKSNCAPLADQTNSATATSAPSKNRLRGIENARSRRSRSRISMLGAEEDCFGFSSVCGMLLVVLLIGFIDGG